MYQISNFGKYLPQHYKNVVSKPSQFQASKEFKEDEDTFKMNVFFEPYNTPKERKMLVILPFFSPCNSVRMLQNMLVVKNKLVQADIPFVVIHCLFPNNSAISKESSQYMTVKSNSYAFVKENLVNIAIKKHINEYDNFLVHDGDIIFEDKDWYDNVCNTLRKADIIHPYESFVNFTGHHSSSVTIFPLSLVFFYSDVVKSSIREKQKCLF
jgi:hypothetical protein